MIHAGTDSRGVFSLDGHAISDNRSDTGEFVIVPDEVGARTGESSYADKGSRSQLDRYVLHIGRLSDDIRWSAPATLLSMATASFVPNISVWPRSTGIPSQSHDF